MTYWLPIIICCLVGLGIIIGGLLIKAGPKVEKPTTVPPSNAEPCKPKKPGIFAGFGNFLKKALYGLTVLVVAVAILYLVSFRFNHISEGGTSQGAAPVAVQTAVESSGKASASNELTCPEETREQHACVLPEGPTRLIRGPELPAGLNFCLTPELDGSKATSEERRWRSVRAVLDNGVVVELAEAHSRTDVAGIEVTPMHPGMTATYWASDTPCHSA